ncbi:MAG TPA: type II toxin-antitoxin system VapC family toxin [Bryobacteraceae bacterium]|nr:type II toxin-antitoxin system VapC family toxin [Bryobacteraceae bacterium]
MAWLLDTNILSEGRKPRPEPRVTAFYETQPLNDLYISVVNIAEIRYGIELQEDPARRAQLNEWLTLTLRPAFAGRILPLTEDIMLKWRLLMNEGRKSGHTYSHPDLLLAATAIQHGLTVVTRDRSDFDMARVPVFNPWETT